MLRSRVAFTLYRPIACALAATALAALSVAVAAAAPLPESSPLYSPGAPLVDENGEVSAEYSGTATELFEYPSVGGDPEHVHRTAKLEWSEGITGPIDQIEYTAIYGAESIHWHVTQLSGEVKENSTDIGGKAVSCSGKFLPRSVDGGEAGVSLPLDEPGLPASGGNPETNPDYRVHPPLGMPSSLVESTGTGDCETGFWNSNGDSGWGNPVFSFASEPAKQMEWDDKIGPTVYFPRGGTHTEPLEFSYTCQPPECGPESNGTERFGKVSITVTSSIEFTSPGESNGAAPITQKSAPPHETFGPPTPFNWLDPDKRAARLDLDPALENAKSYCTPYALGLGGFGTGVLLLSSGSVGGILAVAGSVAAAATNPFCVATLSRVATDVKRYKDPPDTNIYAIARPAATKSASLPSCRRWHGRAARFCKRLRPAEASWVASARRVATIDEALSTTTNRLSAATAAGAFSAIAAQSAAGQQLQAQEETALGEKAKDGQAVARVLRSAHLRFKLTKAQSKLTIRAVELALVKQGIPTSMLTSLGSPSLQPQAVDLLAGLSR
jgi:hypothetical protein